MHVQDVINLFEKYDEWLKVPHSHFPQKGCIGILKMKTIL